MPAAGPALTLGRSSGSPPGPWPTRNDWPGGARLPRLAHKEGSDSWLIRILRGTRRSSPKSSARMCSDYRLLERVPVEALFPFLLHPEGIPNFEPREDIRITDRAPILRAAGGGAGGVELV